MLFVVDVVLAADLPEPLKVEGRCGAKSKPQFSALREGKSIFPGLCPPGLDELLSLGPGALRRRPAFDRMRCSGIRTQLAIEPKIVYSSSNPLKSRTGK